MGGKLADQRGRREAIVINICIFLIGGVLQTMAHSMTTIIMARFIIGFGSGMCTVLVPIYLGEMAPVSELLLVFNLNYMQYFYSNHLYSSI